MQSCVQDEKDLFEQSASERMATAQKDCLDVLLSAPNGWVIKYYSDTNIVGGFQLLASFKNDGTVTVSGENILSNQDPTLKITSLYKLKSDQGPVISFDTYNKFIHMFANPNPDGKGFGGDYEFIIMSVTSDQIILKGKKTGNKIVMNKFSKTEPTAWETYLTELNTLKVNSFSPNYLLIIGDKQFLVKEKGMRILNFVEVSENNLIEYSAPYIITEKGIELYTELKIAGKVLKNFEWNDTEKALVCKDSDVAAKIVPIPAPINERFIKSTSYWIMTADDMSDDFKAGFAKAVKVNTDKGEKLSYVVFNFNTGAKIPVIMVGMKDAANKSKTLFYIPDYTPAINSIDQLSVNSIVPNDASASTYLKAGYDGIFSLISGQDFILTPDNATTPTKIKFTNAKNPNSWYTLSAM